MPFNSIPNLVGKVDVSGGVDEVEDIRLPVVRGVFYPGRVEFDGDSPLPL